jgi:hypothetical protein
MELGKLMIAGALWLAGTSMAVRAQSPEETRAELPSLVRDAFDSEYGKAVVAEFGQSLRNNADAACLSAKGIAPDQLEPRGRDLIVKWGLRMQQTANDFIDPKIYNEKFIARAGRGAATELAQLRNDADVKRSLALERPIQLAEIVNSVFEQFDRYVLIKRIKLTAVTPSATGNTKLLELDPTEAAEKKYSQFNRTSTSSALKKFLKLSQQSLIASTAATNTDDLAKASPSAFFGGVEADLAELCIGPKQ